MYLLYESSVVTATERQVRHLLGGSLFLQGLYTGAETKQTRRTSASSEHRRYQISLHFKTSGNNFCLVYDLRNLHRDRTNRMRSINIAQPTYNQ